MRGWFGVLLGRLGYLRGRVRRGQAPVANRIQGNRIEPGEAFGIRISDVGEPCHFEGNTFGVWASGEDEPA